MLCYEHTSTLHNVWKLIRKHISDPSFTCRWLRGLLSSVIRSWVVHFESTRGCYCHQHQHHYHHHQVISLMTEEALTSTRIHDVTSQKIASLVLTYLLGDKWRLFVTRQFIHSTYSCIDLKILLSQFHRACCMAAGRAALAALRIRRETTCKKLT